MARIVSSSSPSPSSTTATGLPAYGTSVNTSTWRNGLRMPASVPAAGTSGERLAQRLAGEGHRLGVVGVGHQVDDETVDSDGEEAVDLLRDLVLSLQEAPEPPTACRSRS